MQISSLAQVSHARTVAALAPGRAVTIDGVGSPRIPAPVAQPRERSEAVAQARAGAQLVDFPGIVAGDTFELVKGSKVGPIGIKGEAEVKHLDDDSAAFHVRGGRFGIKLDVDVEIARTGDDTALIKAHGTGLDPYQTEARIAANRTNFVDFEHLGSPEGHTVFSSDGQGHVVIDTVLPTFGDVHLELERR